MVSMFFINVSFRERLQKEESPEETILLLISTEFQLLKRPKSYKKSACINYTLSTHSIIT